MNDKLYNKIKKDIEFCVESGLVEKEKGKINIIENFFERGIILGKEEGYREAEKKFNKRGMYLEDDE